MSLYDRFRGLDDEGVAVPKLPIWHTITCATEILAGTSTDSDAVDRFDLDGNDLLEFIQVKTHIESTITALATALITSGVDADAATQIAKGVVRNDVSQILLRAELGYCTREEFNTDLGIA